MAMNAIIITFSSTAVAAFGVCTKIQNITTVGVHGITNGLIPIVAYNYGAKQKERIRQSIRYGILYGGGLFLIFFCRAGILSWRCTETFLMPRTN